MPVVRAVPALVLLDIADLAVDVSMAQGSPDLPYPVLVTTVAVPALAATAAPVESAGRTVPVSAMAPMAPMVAAAFTVAPAPAPQRCLLRWQRWWRW